MNFRRQPPSSVEASQIRKAVRQRDTTPDVSVRSLFHRQGFRYRVDCRPGSRGPRRADLVFVRIKVGVFMDGCSWYAALPRGHYR